MPPPYGERPTEHADPAIRIDGASGPCPRNLQNATLEPLPGETVIEKSTNSAFIGTDLEARLRDQGITTLVVTGVITNNSVEATVRMAGNLGFDVFVVTDATATVDKPDLSGRMWSAEEVHQLSLANMHGEYATAMSMDEVLSACDRTIV